MPRPTVAAGPGGSAQPGGFPTHATRYSPTVTEPQNGTAKLAAANAPRLKTFRRPPGPAEQARREQFGHTWGGMIKRAYEAEAKREG